MLVCVGRLTEAKGQALAIEALARMATPDARLRLVGDGEDEAMLREAAERAGVAGRVEFTGAVEDAAPHLRAADVVVVPSKWDAQSLVLLEAMACGAAVLATRVPGSSAVEDVGVIAQRRDPAEFAAEADALLADSAPPRGARRRRPRARGRPLRARPLEPALGRAVDRPRGRLAERHGAAVTFAETRTRMPVRRRPGRHPGGRRGRRASSPAPPVSRPVEVALPIVGVIGGIAVLRSPTLALSLLISSAFFEGYLTRTGVSLTKVIGLAAVLAWGIDWALRRRRPVTTPHMLWLIGLAVWLATSVLIAGERSNAMSTSARYASFFVLFFLTVQVASRGRRRLELLVTVTVAAAAAAAAAGLFDYLVVHHGRAAGPLAGANDFAFLLGSTLPLAVWRFRWAGAGLAPRWDGGWPR